MEIGSEYDLKLSDLTIKENNIFRYLSEYKCIYTDSGRSSLKLLTVGLGETVLPEFICESVINCFDKSKLRFYHIDEQGKIDLDSLKKCITHKTKCIFIMHYFGSMQDKEILQEIREIANKREITVIEDTTHSIFSEKSTVGDYMIASLRKWFPVSLGGVLYSKKELPDCGQLSKSQDNDRIYAFILKRLFLLNVLDCNSIYRNIFSCCEEKLNKKNKPELMSDLNSFIISCYDIEELKAKRNANFEYLSSKLSDHKLFPIAAIKENDCPFVFPLRVKNRDAFRKYLIDNKIYCAVHWPFDNFKEEERRTAVYNAKTLISLPIDQRYNKKDMDYLVKIIKSYGGEFSF